MTKRTRTTPEPIVVSSSLTQEAAFRQLTKVVLLLVNDRLSPQSAGALSESILDSVVCPGCGNRGSPTILGVASWEIGVYDLLERNVVCEECGTAL